jgi:hypothetical protein
MSILLISDETPLKYQFNRKLIAPTYNASEHTMLVSLPYSNRVCGIQQNVFNKIKVNLCLDEFASCDEANHLDG